MTAGRLLAGLGLAGTALAAVAALAWGLGHLMPPPYSGLLAAILVALAATEVIKRRPRQRALRALRVYMRARERGLDEAGARARVLARLARGPDGPETEAQVARAWVGESERDRILGGLAALLARQGCALDAGALGAAYDRVRDQFSIPAWSALPEEFVVEVHRRLDEGGRRDLEALADKYRLLEQKFFRRPTALGLDPPAGADAFARLLASLGNRLAEREPGHAERAYRISLRLRPERNLAHAGLALLLARTGRTGEAAREARLALDVLDDYARQPPGEAPVQEDIFPYRSPDDLRRALEALAGGG